MKWIGQCRIRLNRATVLNLGQELGAVCCLDRHLVQAEPERVEHARIAGCAIRHDVYVDNDVTFDLILNGLLGRAWFGAEDFFGLAVQRRITGTGAVAAGAAWTITNAAGSAVFAAWTATLVAVPNSRSGVIAHAIAR